MTARREHAHAPLLSRIEQGGAVRLTSRYWTDEIGRALLALFNTHYGSAPICEAFGMPEFHPDEMNSVTALQQKANEIKGLIQRFEPRLTHLRVAGRIEDQNTGRALFEIEGMLDESLAHERVSYHTVMTGQGRVWLRK